MLLIFIERRRNIIRNLVSVHLSTSLWSVFISMIKRINKWEKTMIKIQHTFFFFVFLEPHAWHMEVPRLKGSCSHWPMPKPQQRQIWVSSATYTTAYSNAGSLTHWTRPGIEPASSWMLIRFVSAESQQELPAPPFDRKGNLRPSKSPIWMQVLREAGQGAGGWPQPFWVGSSFPLRRGCPT